MTSKAKPTAPLLTVEDENLETVTLSTDPQFLAVIERSRARQKAEGGSSPQEMRRRLGLKSRTMLFVALLCFKPELTREQRNAAAQRRTRWNPPPGVTSVAEYWLRGSSYVVMVFEAESAPAILGTFANWDDVFDIQVYPAITPDEGLRALQQAGIIRRRAAAPGYQHKRP